MTWTFIAHRGTANNKTSGTQISVSPNAGINAGRILVVRCVSDNTGTTSGETTEHSLADSKANTYTKIREQRFSAGAAEDGVVGSLWISRLTTALTVSDTVTLTLGTARVAKAIALEELAITGTGITVTAKNGASQAGTTAPTVTLSGLSSAEYLWLGHVATEGPNGDAFTQDTDYTNNTSVGTTGGTATANVSSRFGTRIWTGAGDTYNPTLGTARDCTTVIAAVQELFPEAKSFSDAAAASEAYAIPFKAMQFTQAFTASDAYAIVFKALRFTDATAASDAFSIVLKAMGFSDSASAADIFVLLKELGFSDAATASDAFSIAFKQLGFQDTVSSADPFSIAFKALRFTDAAAFLDAFEKTIQEAVAKQFSDSASAADTFALIYKALGFTDAISLSELFSKEQVTLETIQKAFADLAAAITTFQKLSLLLIPLRITQQTITQLPIAEDPAKATITQQPFQQLKITEEGKL